MNNIFILLCSTILFLVALFFFIKWLKEMELKRFIKNAMRDLYHPHESPTRWH